MIAAREVFTADPTAPISAVAKRAGVGIGALYSRYQSKEDLLRALSRHGQDIYIAEVERALASDDEPWVAFVGYLRNMVAASTHGLTVRLAGTFTPTAEQFVLAERMQARSIELVARLHATGDLRADVTHLDIDLLLESLATVKLGNAERSAELRQRHLSIIIDGLHSHHPTSLPGTPPTWEEQNARWATNKTSQAREDSGR